ncbi:uncharacterized protein LOC111324887 [Stylophora pistillata]|uniref:uncharacterized protein LOC111324887 n=1 Tax=Stylophora pistillata TaxID=50429 RepID=UPI000C047320|nr:uncharacterized protein LOC111324887 [Stylophora pistillata]
MLEENIKKIHKEFDYKKKMTSLMKTRKRSMRRSAVGYVPKFTPVIFHNLAGYDSDLFVKNLGKTEGDIKCIPNNEEKYISFSKSVAVGSYTKKEEEEVDIKTELRFIDSSKFMASSLDKLVSNLSHDKLKKTGEVFKDAEIKLISRKGVYSYDYMSSIEKFGETELPPKREFYSKLNDCDISEEDYEHAKKIWNEFKMRNMGDYHDLYLKSNVLLLADVFEEFRNVCLENYNLDPAWYYTAPGLAWDAALKVTKVELELLSDPDMLLMFEKGIRGRISMIPNRYGKANNMNLKFDREKPSKYLAYLDANNLYGWAMCKPLPVRGFKWVSQAEIGDWRASVRNIPCILEVDLEYPKELHDYPLAPERIMISSNKVENFLPNLNEKKKYIIPHQNLKQCLELGLRLKKIYRGIKFEEEPWLKSYIELNTNLRTNAKNKFEKDFFKLMNNSVFGKTMENIRKRVDVGLLNNRKKAQKLSAKPNFKHCTIFDENLIAIHMGRTSIKFDKPVFCGMAILDLSKTLMYDFHYNYIKKKYGDKAKLLFTDNDNLMYEIETEDFYKDIAADVEEKFDTSNFPKDHISKIPTGCNKKVVGMMKDQAGGKIIEEFVGLRAELYSLKILEGKEEKKCKGIKKTHLGHKGISVWALTQQMTSIAKPFRENIAALVLFYTPSAKDMEATFDDYAGDLTKEERIELIAKLKNEKYSHLILSLCHPSI